MKFKLGNDISVGIDRVTGRGSQHVISKESS